MSVEPRPTAAERVASLTYGSERNLGSDLQAAFDAIGSEWEIDRHVAGLFLWCIQRGYSICRQDGIWEICELDSGDIISTAFDNPFAAIADAQAKEESDV